MPKVDPRNTARYWEHERIRGLGLMWADFSTHEYPPHVHDGLVLAMTEAGGSVIKSRGVEDEARPSALFVFNPGEPHSGHMGSSPRWRYRALYFEAPALATVERVLGITDLPCFLRNGIEDRELAARTLTLHRSLERAQDAVASEELLCRTFGLLLQRYGEPRPRYEHVPVDRAVVARIVEHVHACYDRGVSLEEMAAEDGLTPFQLIRLFKRTIGLTPHAFLTQVRLDSARKRLRRGEPIAEVAAAVGFYDQAALTHHFKKSYGITPSQYAAAVGIGGARQRSA